MSNELIKTSWENSPSTEMASTAYTELAKPTNKFLQRIQLYSKGEAIDTGKVRPGHYGIPRSKDKIVDLGDSIDVLVLARRPKAMDMSDSNDIVTVYDADSEEFQRIREASSKPNSNCMIGVSFLVVERSTGEFYEIFFKGTAAPVSDDVTPYMARDGQPPKPVTLKSSLQRSKKHKSTWFIPLVVPCSTPIELDTTKAFEEIEKFINPPKTEVVDKPANQRAR